MTTNTGGPAFPAPAGVAHITEQGMSLRDYFAAKAMQGMLSNPDSDGTEDQFAGWAYQSADAMLKARGTP